MFPAVRMRGAVAGALIGLFAWFAPLLHAGTPSAAAGPGMLTVAVDLGLAPKRIFRVHETIPVEAGPLTLHYPKWIPGEHAPTGPIENVTGLVIRADGKRLPWRRDLVDMYALHLDVPAGASSLELGFQFLSPGDGGAFGAGVSATADLVVVEFNQVAFYPAGRVTRDIRIRPEVTLPAGWQFATAMQVASRQGERITFQPLSFEDFVDSPLLAGRHFKRVDLDPGARVPVRLDIAGDRADDVIIDERQIAQHRALVKQAYALFGGHHYDHYDFLLTLSDRTSHFGLEHHQSSDNRLMAGFFTDDDAYLRVASLMPHEFVHSWNGKFRRPADLATRDFTTPMKTDLLWVYEGLTDYWAGVLTARSGLWTKAEYRDALAGIAAHMQHRRGRAWRSLQDTADAAPLLSFGGSWSNWRRGVDYYPEGQLLWLDVDTRIRELSNDRRSLDDFARAFFGVDDDSRAVRAYTFDDVVAALGAVQPADWAAFLRQRLDYTGDDVPEHGLARSGWKLVYTDQPSAYDEAGSRLMRGALDLSHSLGITLSGNGHVRDVQWGGTAFDAGLVPGMDVVAVGGKGYSAGVLKDAITAAVGGNAPITLLVKYDEIYSTVSIDYHGGLRYPHLERIEGHADLLDDILAPRQ